MILMLRLFACKRDRSIDCLAMFFLESQKIYVVYLTFFLFLGDAFIVKNDAIIDDDRDVKNDDFNFEVGLNDPIPNANGAARLYVDRRTGTFRMDDSRYKGAHFFASYVDETNIVGDPRTQCYDLSNLHLDDRYWHVDRIDQSDTIALDHRYCISQVDARKKFETRDVRYHVFVMDTGITSVANDEHFLLFPYTERFVCGMSVFDDDVFCDDCHGHGTAVASVVSDVLPDDFVPNVTIRSVKVLDCLGKGDLETVMKGLSWIESFLNETKTKKDDNVEHKSIVNMSFGAKGVYSATFDRTIERMKKLHGTVFIASAGNDGYPSSCDVWPSNVPHVVSVGATDTNDERASFSNYGPCVDAYAPGKEVYALHAEKSKDDSETLDLSFQTYSGTSFSAPMVTGAVITRWQQRRLQLSESFWGNRYFDAMTKSENDDDSFVRYDEIESIVTDTFLPFNTKRNGPFVYVGPLSKLTTHLPSSSSSSLSLSHLFIVTTITILLIMTNFD